MWEGKGTALRFLKENIWVKWICADKDHISKTLEGSDINMEADTESEQPVETILNVTDENIRQDDFYDEIITASSDDESEDILFTAEDSYNF